MKAVIIEDEPLAAEKLERYLSKYDQKIKVVKVLPSLKIALPWIKSFQKEVDLFFFDVQLSDGFSFEIFKNIKITKPVIFTTAFDEYAIDAFKVNSIEYLMKPISYTALCNALNKLDTLKMHFQSGSALQDLGKIRAKQFKDRFLVRQGNHLYSVPTSDVAYFFAEGRDVFLVTNKSKKYLIDYKLERLQEMLDPNLFFRVNRSFIISITCIKDTIVHSNRRLKVIVFPYHSSEVIVSRDKVALFKDWLHGE